MSDTPLTLRTIYPEDGGYPVGLTTCSAFKTPPTLATIGHLELLAQSSVALFCSTQCSGNLILKTYDLAQALRNAEIPVISGFHTPIEQDCLKILLCGIQPVIHCLARSLHNVRLSPAQKQAIGENRLLLLSPFKPSYSRATVDLAGKRNEMIGAISHTILITYAAPNSKTLAFAQSLVSTGKSVITFAGSSSPLLQEEGISGLSVDAIVQRCLGIRIR